MESRHVKLASPEDRVLSTRLLALKPPRIAQFLVAIAALTHWAIPVQLEIFSNSILGVLVVAAGFYAMMAGWWLFRKHRTVICPTGRPTTLIVDGIYGITRNPMYLGISAMLIGIAVIVGTLPFYIAAIAYVAVMDTVFCPYEERRLQQVFGDDFLRYKTRVRRWL